MSRKLLLTGGIALLLLAAGLVFYPLVSNLLAEKNESRVMTRYEQEVAALEEESIRTMLEKATAYNRRLASGEALSYDTEKAAGDSYEELLCVDGAGMMGTVEIPRLELSLPIYHGTEGKTLQQGIGHLPGSSLPVGGSGTHSVLTGHSGMAGKKMFSDLGQLETGDVFYIHVLGRTLAYRVDQIKTVLPENTEDLKIEEGKDYCTLVTCTPFGVNTHRLLVRGVRIPAGEEKQAAAETETAERADSVWQEEYRKGLWVGLACLLPAAAVLPFAVRKKK